MAIVYRLEKKKILRSQINLIKKVLSVLRRIEEVLNNENDSDKNRSYQELILEETQMEIEWREELQSNSELPLEEKKRAMEKLE